MRALDSYGCAPIVLVVPVGEVARASDATAGMDGVVVTEGGATRQESVARGLALVTTDRVVVHDAARPFLTAELIERVVAALLDADGAIAAVPADETMKRVEGERVVETLDRSGVWRAQTPQAFHTAILRSAHERAATDVIVATDDAQLVERVGGTVRVVEGDRRNVKLTYAEDFDAAEFVAASWR